MFVLMDQLLALEEGLPPEDTFAALVGRGETDKHHDLLSASMEVLQLHGQVHASVALLQGLVDIVTSAHNMFPQCTYHLPTHVDSSAGNRLEYLDLLRGQLRASMVNPTMCSASVGKVFTV